MKLNEAVGRRILYYCKERNITVNCIAPGIIESEMIKSFAVIVICQLLALEIATLLGRNVDKPKGLHKVVV